MTIENVRTYQGVWLKLLEHAFRGDCVKEWVAFPGIRDRYSPRLDLAVGPFSTTPDQQKIDEYYSLAKAHQILLERLWSCHLSNEAQFDARDNLAPDSLSSALGGNRNARCFLAIEIENAVSRKHLMGGI